MRILLFAVSFSSLSLMVSCGSEESADKSYKPQPVFQQGNNSPSNSQGISPVMNGNSSSAQPVSAPAGSETNAIIPASANTSVNQQMNIASGLNPEHGQPGHRCDIAVGAQLNSKPSAPVTQTATPPAAPQIITSPAPITTGSKTIATGLNPEHGQPGHRCDIAVGAPLDSKPAATPAITNTNQPSAVKPMSITPVLPAAKTEATMPAYQPGTTSTAGLNPEHGKPGHRCDIAVGAPLNSKPANN